MPLTIAPDVMFRHLNDEAVLLDLKSGTYFGLNDVGARTWQLILEHGRLSRVLEALLQEYDVDREAGERDLLALAGQLVTRQLAVVKPHGSLIGPPGRCSERQSSRPPVSALLARFRTRPLQGRQRLCLHRGRPAPPRRAAGRQRRSVSPVQCVGLRRRCRLEPRRKRSSMAVIFAPAIAILLAGSGTGRDLIGLRLLGYDVTGVEPSAEVVEIARQHLVDCGMSAPVRRASIRDCELSGAVRRRDLFQWVLLTASRVGSARCGTASCCSASCPRRPGHCQLSRRGAHSRVIGRWLTRIAARMSSDGLDTGRRATRLCADLYIARRDPVSTHVCSLRVCARM